MAASRVLQAALGALACVLAGSAYAAEDTGELAQSFASLQARDQYLLDIGWKLARTNAPYCPNAGPSIGLLLQDLAGYGRNHGPMRELLQIDGDIAIQALASGSPAAESGLAANSEVLLLDGVDLRAARPDGQESWQRLAALHDAIDRSLATDDVIAIAWLDGAGTRHDAVIESVPACASRFEVLDDGGKAMAEGSRVIFGRDFPGFDYPEPEFAAAVAHELAHNLLGHRAWLAEHGRKRKNIRLTEREADRLMPWLLANAGYDPDAAKSFMERWGPRHGGGLLRKRTHDGWDERAEFIDQEIARIAALTAQGEPADWASHFRREIEP